MSMMNGSERSIERPLVAAADVVAASPTVIAGARIAVEARDERTRAFWAFCRAQPSTDGLAHREAVDMLALRRWLGFVMVLDPLDGESDFRYRLYGSGIANASGFDMTGRRVSEFNSKTGAFFLDCYRRCLQERQALLTWNLAEHARGMLGWERLLVPFQTKDGGRQIVATNIPLPFRDLQQPARA